MKTTRIVKHAVAASAMAGAVVMALPGAAQADTLSGWIGTTFPPVNGVTYLHQSTIINAPSLIAQSKIYTVTGQDVAPGDIGVRARLFKSGALCEAVDYRYNIDPAPELTYGTTAQCGTGWYNSHGYVAAWDGVSTYKQFVTFPTDPLYYTAPAARSARAAAPETIEVESGTNEKGQTYGSGEGVEIESDLPELVAAIGTNGEIGYVARADLGAVAADPTAAVQEVATPRTVPLYDKDGSTMVGEFTFS